MFPDNLPVEQSKTDFENLDNSSNNNDDPVFAKYA